MSNADLILSAIAFDIIAILLLAIYFCLRDILLELRKKG